MSRFDINDRVYAHDSFTGVDDDTEAPCMWFALCKNPANGLREGPVGNGAFGPIPICQRCDDKIARLSGLTA